MIPSSLLSLAAIDIFFRLPLLASCPYYSSSIVTALHHHSLPLRHHTLLGPLFLSATDSFGSNLLYQEQERLIVQRGVWEEALLTNLSPLKAPSLRRRRSNRAAAGFGKCTSRKGYLYSAHDAEEYVQLVQEEGVVRIDNVLRASTADSLRNYLYQLREQSEREVNLGDVPPIQRFADVLLKRNRCDLTMPMGDPIVTQALEEVLRGSPIGATILSIFGQNAILHEFSCLMSDPGSQRQVIHPDTPHIDGKGPVLYTCFIALQDVTVDMGPTIWLPRTHTKEAHDAFKDTSAVGDDGESRKDLFLRLQPAVLGTLSKGSCAIFDSRVLHCGTANQSVNNISRALFYFSFKNPKVGYPGNPASIRAELRDEKLTLGTLMQDLELYSCGNGSPLMERLGNLIQ